MVKRSVVWPFSLTALFKGNTSRLSQPAVARPGAKVRIENSLWWLANGLAHLGDFGYNLLLRLNHPLNWGRRVLGLGYWSLSAYAKQRVKSAVNFIGKYEEAIVRYSKEDKVDGVVCGHIHSPIIRTIGSIEYLNSGDWVESNSALVEDFTGRIELITHFPGSPTLEITAPSSESISPT